MVSRRHVAVKQSVSAALGTADTFHFLPSFHFISYTELYRALIDLHNYLKNIWRWARASASCYSSQLGSHIRPAVTSVRVPDDNSLTFVCTKVFSLVQVFRIYVICATHTIPVENIIKTTLR